MKEKIGITAEFASIIKSESDPRYLYFVSPKALRIYRWFQVLVPKNLLKNIFTWRQNLSKALDLIIDKQKPLQVIDLGSGYSLRGFNLCLSDGSLVYIDSDLSNVTSRKIQILNLLCGKENIKFPQNLHLRTINVLSDDIYSEVKDYIDMNKKTLILAEGLTSYFNSLELEIFFKNIQNLMGLMPNITFYSNERLAEPKGFLYKFIRKILSYVTRSQNSHRFKTSDEFIRFLANLKILDCKIEDTNSGHLIYSFGSKTRK